MKTLFKTKVCQAVLVFLYRALKVLARKEGRIKREFEGLHEGFTVAMTLSPNGPSFMMKKENGKLKRVRNGNAEIEIKFKSIDSAFLVFTGMMGISRAYSEHRFQLKGDIGETMALVRIIDLAESYLFPSFMNKRILRSLPAKERSTLSVYRMAILGF